MILSLSLSLSLFSFSLTSLRFSIVLHFILYINLDLNR